MISRFKFQRCIVPITQSFKKLGHMVARSLESDGSQKTKAMANRELFYISLVKVHGVLILKVIRPHSIRQSLLQQIIVREISFRSFSYYFGGALDITRSLPSQICYPGRFRITLHLLILINWLDNFKMYLFQMTKCYQTR